MIYAHDKIIEYLSSKLIVTLEFARVYPTDHNTFVKMCNMQGLSYTVKIIFFSVGPVTLESDSIPVVKSSTTTTLTITFKQDDMSVDSGVDEYYYYVLQYKTQNAQDSSYTDGTSLRQHVTNFGFRAEREFVIDSLQKNTAYQIRLVLYRKQNGIQDELAVTASTTGTTDCSGKLLSEYNISSFYNV